MSESGSFRAKFPNCTLKVPENLSEQKLFSFRPFYTWYENLSKSLDLQRTNAVHPFHQSPFKLQSLDVQAVDFFGAGEDSRIGFIKFRATITNDKGEYLPGAVFMRGGSVAILIILSEQGNQESDEHVILTIQPRIAASSLSFIELPAGMIDDSGTFKGAAAKEIEEETGLKITEDELIDMTEMSIDQQTEVDGGVEGHLHKASYPSPGGSDEFIPLFVVRKQMKKAEMEDLEGKLTGLRGHGEKITLRLVRLQDVWKVAARDGKTLAAIALYEGLKREARL